MDDKLVAERAEFERIHLGGNKQLAIHNSTTDDYVSPSINDAWAGWRSRAELAARDGPKQPQSRFLPWSPEDTARRFHEAYEEFAPSFGYKTREASAKPWADVPQQNKDLMIAVVRQVFIEQIPDVAARGEPVARDARAYAIEHAGYLATSAEALLTAANALHASANITEGPATYEALESYSEHARGLANDIYEFRKRADRVSTPPAQRVPREPWLPGDEYPRLANGHYVHCNYWMRPLGAPGCVCMREKADPTPSAQRVPREPTAEQCALICDQMGHDYLHGEHRKMRTEVGKQGADAMGMGCLNCATAIRAAIRAEGSEP